jgi:hypothetical protein
MMAEKYVKNWYAKQSPRIKLKTVHKEGHDLVSISGDLYVEVKGSTKDKFNDFRPYFTFAELKKAIQEEKNTEFIFC